MRRLKMLDMHDCGTQETLQQEVVAMMMIVTVVMTADDSNSSMRL